MKLDLKAFLPFIAAAVIFILINTIYFLPQMEGKKIRQTDIIQHKSIASEYIDYRDDGENILWTNTVFSGMPTYQIVTQAKTNISRYIEKLFSLNISAPFGIFLVGLFACYFAFVIMGINKWLAIIGSVLCTFTPNNLVLFEAGHTSKLRAILFTALIFIGVFKLFNKKYITGAVTFCLGMALSIGANHLQMTYYVGLTLLLFGIVALVQFIMKKDLKSIPKIVGIGLAVLLVAIGTGATVILPTYEYSKTTMRGKPIIKKAAEKTNSISSSSVEGLNWDYANQWSNGFNDLMSIYIPGVAGGGSNEPIARNGATNKFMKKNGQRRLEYGPMYWGKLPFTSGPAYLGAIAIFLFLVSLFVLDGKLRYWGIAAVLFTLMVSMGKNLEWFNRLLFDYVPLFNKFRAPSSITSVTGVIISILGLMGVDKILRMDRTSEEAKKVVKYIIYSASALGVISLFYALIGPGFYDFESTGDARYAQQQGLVEAFQKERANIMRRDALRSLGLVLGAASILYFFLKGKINKIVTIALFSVLVLIDIFPVNARYLNYKSFVKPRTVENVIQKRPVDNQILQDTDPYYRVHDASLGGQAFQSASSSKFHKMIGGYHAAKLQRYADMIDYHLSKGNESVFNMLNAKYFILGSPGKEEVRKNANALGNAWFVQNVQYVDEALQEIEALNNINTKTTAVVHNEFKDKIAGKSDFSAGGSIQLTSYHPDKLTYKSSNSSEGLAIFSEVWYGPNLGWKLYVDGKETPLIRTNYILRAAMIPAGDHELVMEFKPRSFLIGTILSSIFSLLLLGGIIFLIYRGLKKDPETE